MMAIMKKTNAYVKIHFEDHDYTATVRERGQLLEFLSSKFPHKFTIGSVSGDWEDWLVQELTQISRFAHSQNATETISYSPSN